jgi:hypothetical protein
VSHSSRSTRLALINWEESLIVPKFETVTLSCPGMLPTCIFYRNVTDAARVSSLQAQQGLHRERICDSRWLIVLQESASSPES